MIEIENIIAIAKESIQVAEYDRQRFNVNAIQVVGGDDDGEMMLISVTTRFEVKPGSFLTDHSIIFQSDITSEEMLREFVVDTVEMSVSACDHEAKRILEEIREMGPDVPASMLWKPPVEEGTFCDYTFEAKPFGSFPNWKSPPRIGDEE